MRTTQEVDPLEERLAAFADSGEAGNLEDIELSQPFMDRVVYPLAKALGDIALKFTPQNALQDAARQLEMAGNPRGLEPTTYFALRFIVGGIVGSLLFIIFVISPSMSPFTLRNLGITFGFMILGFFVPNL
ncbi:MAG: hypothetical protein OEV06_06910, partial [Anaerolineae bacterium]|nr:hypothetical protein [Anaerolineae bacterium]